MTVTRTSVNHSTVILIKTG